MDTIISVIVPIYRVEKYLNQCLDSICNQTYKNLEIILIDDGSPDNCGKICDEYALKDKRIKVIHKTNGGLSDARNTGLKLASGDYIAYVDSDDYIANNAYEILIREALNHDLDIVAANGLIISNHKNMSPLMKEKSFSQEIMTGIEYMCESIKQKSFHVCVWLNLYKKEILINKQLYFQRELLHEDEEWTPRVFMEAKRVKYIDFKYYYYLVRDGSITNSKDTSKNGLDIVSTCYKLEDLYNRNVSRENKKILNGYLLEIFLGGIYKGRLERKEFKRNIRKKFVIGKSVDISSFLKALLFLLNIKLYCKINQLSKSREY